MTWRFHIVKRIQIVQWKWKRCGVVAVVIAESGKATDPFVSDEFLVHLLVPWLLKVGYDWHESSGNRHVKCTQGEENGNQS